MNAALLSSQDMSWQTPEEVLCLVRKLGSIGLDPCTTNENPTGAVYHLSEGGIQHNWWGCGLVYVNPPYGREIGKWTAKAHEEAAKGAEIILLVPARTDTAWFHRDCWTANAICFWRGRIKFAGAEAGAPFPSALVYWGPRRDRFADIFDRHGFIMEGA